MLSPQMAYLYPPQGSGDGDLLEKMRKQTTKAGPPWPQMTRKPEFPWKGKTPTDRKASLSVPDGQMGKGQVASIRDKTAWA